MTTDGATPFAIVPEHVSDAGRYVYDTAQTLISGVRSTDAEVEALLVTWRGTASDAYAAGWSEVRQGVVEVLEALSEMAEALGVVSARLDAVDQERTQRFSLDLPGI
ncbi:WXG100 family type VII secretion target [Nocardia asiatica]|uniref:WXG100 family type VII secretion target n=1 Tax=Nocardia asiatica TaxID=209252 RepID=UPI0024570076|nr:WXG100 family type VII secretion target [Nocardia asiatica]